MNKLFWVVRGDNTSTNTGYSPGHGDLIGNGRGDGGNGYIRGCGDGGQRDINRSGDFDGLGDGLGALMPALAIPRTLEAHAVVVAAAFGRLP